MNFALFQEHLCATRYLSFCGVDTLVKQEKRTERMVASEDKINFENCVKWFMNHRNWAIFWGDWILIHECSCSCTTDPKCTINIIF